MKKDQILEILRKRLITEIENDDEEWIEELNDLIEKIEGAPIQHIEETYAEEINLNEIRLYVGLNRHKPKRKRKKSSTTTYYKFIGTFDEVTEKAFGIITGTNEMHGVAYRVYYEWIPFSQVVKENDKTYIPAWLINTKGIQKMIDWDDKMVKSNL